MTLDVIRLVLPILNIVWCEFSLIVCFLFIWRMLKRKDRTDHTAYLMCGIIWVSMGSGLNQSWWSVWGFINADAQLSVDRRLLWYAVFVQVPTVLMVITGYSYHFRALLIDAMGKKWALVPVSLTLSTVLLVSLLRVYLNA